MHIHFATYIASYFAIITLVIIWQVLMCTMDNGNDPLACIADEKHDSNKYALSNTQHYSMLYD